MADEAHEQLERSPLPASNLDLYRQLQAGGWSAADLGIVHETYVKAAKLSFGFIRPNSKPFINHLVATAGATALDSRDPLLESAALAHSLLRFNTLSKLQCRLKGTARLVREHIGDDIFQLIEAYEQTSIGDWLTKQARVTPQNSKFVHLRLADRLDDLLDELAPVACAKRVFESGNQQQELQTAVSLAEEVGAPKLAHLYRSISACDFGSRPTFVDTQKRATSLMIDF